MGLWGYSIMPNRLPCLSIVFLFCATLLGDFQTTAAIGTPRMNGEGCPPGSARTLMQSGGNNLAIHFKGFQARSAGRRQQGRTSCNISVPIEVPRGQQFSISSLQYSGFNDLPSGAQSTFRAEHFFAGQRGPKFARTFRGRNVGAFNLSDRSATTFRNWSPCGRDVNLRVNASLMLSGNGTSEIGGRNNPGISYGLRWRRCR